MAKFEKISKYANVDIAMPQRKSEFSAGYDMVVAEEIIIPPYAYLMNEIVSYVGIDRMDDPVTLDEMKDITKGADAKPVLIPTGMKCKLADDEYLELSVRSSCPLKHWLILANSVGIIDSDYYNNEVSSVRLFNNYIFLSTNKRDSDVLKYLSKLDNYYLCNFDECYGESLRYFAL